MGVPRKESPAASSAGWTALSESGLGIEPLRVSIGALDPGPYLLGDGFSAADGLYARGFQWAPHMMPQGPAFEAYVARIAARPALQRGLAKDAGKR